MGNYVGFMCVYPPTLIIVRKMVRYVDLKIFLSSENICLYMIHVFDWLSVSFRYAVKLRDWFYG